MGRDQFWYEQGAKRVVTARELSLAEIKEIREYIPEEMEIETFIMGRCVFRTREDVCCPIISREEMRTRRLHPSVPVEVCGRGRVQTGGVSAGV